ncbi:MAG: response regulator [Armatimonadota bacterium]|jgi:DNA-binding NtrC family response regulator
MSEAERAREARILVVDDDKPVRDVLREILLGEGYEVDSASGGAEALERAKAQNYDLVITDVRMDDMDGLTLLHELNELSPAPEVIIITAWPSMDDVLESVRGRAANYIVKPFEVQQVCDIVAQTLEGAEA